MKKKTKLITEKRTLFIISELVIILDRLKRQETSYPPVVLIDNVRLNILFIGAKHTYDSQFKSSILKEFFLIQKNTKRQVTHSIFRD